MTSGLVDTAINSIKEVERSLEDQALKIVAEIQDIIADYNREQLTHGIDGKGQKLKPKYKNVRYKRAKNSINPLPGLGTPDLKLTGRFYSNFYVTAKDGVFKVDSSDEKRDALTSKYGDNIFLITETNEEKINLEEIYPRLLEWIITQLKI